MLVLDIGAVYVSAAVIQVSDNVIKTLALSGDAGAGGLAFDLLLFNKASQEIKEKLGKYPKEDPKSLNKLLLACEKAKNDLSSSQKCLIDLDGLFDEQSFQGCAERETFNQITAEVCKRILGVVECVLSEANIRKNGIKCQNKKEAIDEVIMVGGASRIPMLEDSICRYFQTPVGKQINVEESFAQGAGKLL
jgi:molecular chaperone DnaK (HSP70)